MLIIAVVVAVTIGITKAKLDNIISYTYYNAYSTLRKISTEMLADWDPTDLEYKQSYLDNVDFSYKFFKLSNVRDGIITFYRNLFSSPVFAGASLPDDGFLPGEPTAIKCWDGSWVASETMCPPEPITCWDGSKAYSYDECPPCNNKPNPIPCGQSWNSVTCTLYGTPRTCSDGYTLDSSCVCRCSRSCPTGYKLNTNACSCEKLECTNKPTSIPCGQSWDENTCSLVGTAKTCPDGYALDSSCNCQCNRTCPSGQHLNSSCQCVVDCPSDLTLCKRCDTETGVISQNPDINRTCTDETYEWNEDQCKCVQSPRTLPRKGENFCKLFERHSNIMGNTDVCSGSVVSDGTIDFTGKKADITLGNGIRFYNMHRDATEIDVLAGNIQGGAYEGVPNTNSYGYTVYVDIDGAKGDSQLWSDVYPFYITLSGKIIPAYDKANPGVSGGDSTHHLQVSVQYEDYSSGKRRMKWLSKSTSFKEGACLSGYIGDATPYCKDSGAVTKLSECTTDSNSMCHLKHIQPVKFFF